MRCALLLLAAVASAQQSDSRGFVNDRLLRQNFAKNALKVTASPALLKNPPAATTCAIPPIAAVPMQKDFDPAIFLPPSGPVDEKMILPAMPTCAKR